MALLEVNDLRTHFDTKSGVVRAVDGVSFEVDAGQVLGLVGESGCGKSVTCMTIMGIAGRATSTGTAVFNGESLLDASAKRLREIRGNEITMIFQDPLTSLNPIHKIGHQLIEAVRLHHAVSRKQARARSVDMLKAVGIANAERRMDDYPHQFSGGMRQRVMIATALINSPKLIIADEPTTALDVTTQAQILRLIKRLQSEFNTALIFVTHDLGVVAETADDVVVMYAGKVVETGSTSEMFDEPRHPYTWGLLGSLPRMNVAAERLSQIPGQPPSLIDPPAGCHFHPRCSYGMVKCVAEEPALLESTPGAGHKDACHLSDSVKQAEAAKLQVSLGRSQAS